MQKDNENQPSGEILLYQAEDGRTRIECRFENETLWLSQAMMADLFQVTIPTINEHLKGIYAEGELEPDPTIRKFRIVRLEGARQVTREIEHYNLEAILAVGFRVRSHRGTAFRQWAAARLKAPYLLARSAQASHQKSPVVPEKYSWPPSPQPSPASGRGGLMCDGDELFDHYRHTLEALGLLARGAQASNQKGLQ